MASWVEMKVKVDLSGRLTIFDNRSYKQELSLLSPVTTYVSTSFWHYYSTFDDLKHTPIAGEHAKTVLVTAILHLRA